MMYNVRNPGESFVGVGDTWMDRTDIIGKLHILSEEMNGDGFVYDNFPIRSYPQTELFTVISTRIGEDTVLHKGDVPEGQVTVTNNSGYDYSEEVEFEIVLSCESQKENNKMTFHGVKADETKTITYRYIVTAADTEAGKIECRADLKYAGTICFFRSHI